MPVLIPSGFRPGPARSTVRIPVGERGGVARASDGAASSLFMPKGEERGDGGRFFLKDDMDKDVDGRLEDLDSLRQSLLGVEEGRREGEMDSTGSVQGSSEDR